MLELSDREILNHAGRISHEAVVAKAEVAKTEVAKAARRSAMRLAPSKTRKKR